MPRAVRKKVEPPPQDHFDDQMIGASGESDSDAEIEFPLRTEIEIHRRKDLLLLLCKG